MIRCHLFAAVILLAAFVLPARAFAQQGQPHAAAPDSSASDPSSAPTTDEQFALHGQITFVAQGTPGFASPYRGPNSLAPKQGKETADATLFAGLRPWAGGEMWVNPEVDQGFGLSGTLGVAGFPSAEAYKVGSREPYVRLQRAFLRQTFALGREREVVAPTANQLGGTRAIDRLVVTVGKFGVGDVFDTNIYAHDPRADFFNWAAVDAGTFDYAADAWGYSTGLAAELYRGSWTARAGLFNLSKVPNGETLESGFRQNQIDLEIEHRHRLSGHPGAVRVTLFRNRGRFGRFNEALALAAATATPPDTALVRRFQSRLGASLDIEQELSKSIGIYARAGTADGQIEPYDFTDIDRTAQIGLSMKGNGWGRANDTLGAALIVNGISRDHERYLAAGGLGVLVGDGQLPHPGAEMIAETFYKIAAAKGVEFTADEQLIVNPGYNCDRGPVAVFALRAHAFF